MTKRQALVVGVCSSMLLGLLSFSGLAQGKRQTLVTIEHDLFTRPQLRGAPLLIEALIDSPAGIREAKVYYRQPGEGAFTALTMQRHGEQTYRAVVPDWIMTGRALEYYITAVDLLGTSASRGFVGFPLLVQLTDSQAPTRDDRLNALEKQLQNMRRSKEAPPSGALSSDPWNSDYQRR